MALRCSKSIHPKKQSRPRILNTAIENTTSSVSNKCMRTELDKWVLCARETKKNRFQMMKFFTSRRLQFSGGKYRKIGCLETHKKRLWITSYSHQKFNFQYWKIDSKMWIELQTSHCGPSKKLLEGLNTSFKKFDRLFLLKVTWVSFQNIWRYLPTPLQAVHQSGWK